MDSNGTANSGGNEVGIYLTSAAYKFQLKSAGGVNCASGSPVWTADNVSAAAFLNLPNTWTALQTFGAGISVTGVAIFNGGIGGARIQFQQFTGNGTFTIPANVTAVKVTVVGAGGAGGGGTAAANSAGSGGGGGGIGIKYLSGLTPGNTLTVTVGTGGAGSAGAAGGNGVASSVASGTQVISTITANGGGGGVANGTIGYGTFAALGSGGDMNFAGSPSTSVAASNFGSNGAPGPLFGGLSQGVSLGNSGVIGNAPGAGGSGGGGSVGNTTGGAGANGIVIFEWVN